MKEINELYCWVADNGEGGEGIVGVKMDGVWHPLVSFDIELNGEKMELAAREVMRATGQKMTLKKFVLDKTLKSMEYSKHF